MLVMPSAVVAKCKATIKECSVRDVHGCLDAGTVLIDIREPAEYNRGHIPGAVLLPRGLLEFEILPLLEKRGVDEVVDADIVLYCGTGGRSALAAKIRENGRGWRESGPVPGKPAASWPGPRRNSRSIRPDSAPQANASQVLGKDDFTVVTLTNLRHVVVEPGKAAQWKLRATVPAQRLA